MKMINYILIKFLAFAGFILIVLAVLATDVESSKSLAYILSCSGVGFTFLAIAYYFKTKRRLAMKEMFSQ